MRIFAIDDELGSLGLLEDTLAEVLPNAEILPFHSAKQACEAAKTTPPDVAFLDIEMPGMTGLELSERLRACNERVNLIFVTGYSEYAFEALKRYASDYIMKPVSADAVRAAMEHLRNPLSDEKPVTVKTFGNFAVFAHGVPVTFRLEKSRELLAYLVDREGSPVTRREAAAVLYEEGDFDRNEQKSLSRVASWLAEDLERAGIGSLFRNDEGNYSIDKSAVDCDLYDFLSGGEVKFFGEYMEQYSWGEDRKGEFYS